MHERGAQEATTQMGCMGAEDPSIIASAVCKMNAGGMGELGLIARLKPFLSAGAGGDDAAVIADATGFLVVSADMFVEGVHFDFGWMSPEDVGWRSLALALGDLAAKGADPAWAVASVAIPRSWPVERLEGIYRGMKELAQRFRLSIEGGDLNAGDGAAVTSLPRARAQAQPGWSVGVTGPLGQAAIALRERRPFRFTPLIEDGRRLNLL